MFSFLFWPVISSLLAGGVLTIFYYIYFFLKNFIQSHFISSITIESSDLMFQWILDYLIFKGFISHGLSNFTCKIERNSKARPFWRKSNDFDQDFTKPKISYTPGIGYHSFSYKGFKVYFTHQILDRLTVGFERKPVTVESITLFTYGLSHVKTLQGLCDEAMTHSLVSEKDVTNIYALGDWGSIWEKVQSKRQRPIETVILDANITEEIMNDITNFKQNQQWYIDRGVNTYFIKKINYLTN